ncbi:OLC1v1030387C4 [Oldenlandia corymbosa var. corymbosa]|uniref:OLC1v1030387C4 n=1 Tax=Oldenlandia corymbosa var. corymbosa TaxID=529605 RepID=A0AAV1CGQ9_OLDCO|nr:OLC1v1030387C4 [Oldenlandia corymbosa var. corymbosa]
MGLAPTKRASPPEDETEQQTNRTSLGDAASSIFESVPRKRRSDIPVRLGRQFMTASALSFESSVCSPEGENPGIIQELPSKKVAVCKRKRKSTPDVSIVKKTEANPSSFWSLRVRGRRGGFSSFAQQGKLDDATFEEFRAHIWSTFPEESRKSFSYLDSLWFNLYAEEKAPKQKVLNWIKKKDILSTKYVLVPIVLWSHWSLLILCNFNPSLQSKSPCMLLLDSLQQTDPTRLEPGSYWTYISFTRYQKLCILFAKSLF